MEPLPQTARVPKTCSKTPVPSELLVFGCRVAKPSRSQEPTVRTVGGGAQTFLAKIGHLPELHTSLRSPRLMGQSSPSPLDTGTSVVRPWCWSRPSFGPSPSSSWRDPERAVDPGVKGRPRPRSPGWTWGAPDIPGLKRGLGGHVYFGTRANQPHQRGRKVGPTQRVSIVGGGQEQQKTDRLHDLTTR